MAPSTDIRIRAVSFDRDRIGYRSPIKFGGRVVTDAVLHNVQITVETRNGLVGQGLGSMPMGNVWAWPSNSLSAEATLAAMLRFAELATLAAEKLGIYAHPLDLTIQLAADHASIAKQVETELGLSEPMPILAQLVAASPLEAAIHDAQGKAVNQNSYNLLSSEQMSHDLSHYLSPEFAGEYLDRYTSRTPQPTMPLYHLVGALDPITPDDIVSNISDGLPEALGEWIITDGLTHLKIKLNGDDLAWDVARVVAIENVAAATQATLGINQWNYSLDFNERCAHVDYLLEFLRKVQEQSPAAMSRVQYIEQPTHRDLRKHPENKMHAVARIKPVVIDESLVDFESLLLAQEQGYSGVALKACKGHTEALLMGAAAQKFGMFLCVQDLSCPGYSFLHSASLAARIPTIAAIEGNGRQYCPAGNKVLGNVYPSMFHITDGTVGTGVLTGPGLGF